MTTHHFYPTRYYTTLGDHPAELNIQPGDRVVTTTVDASGKDASGEHITPGGNPLTGPFYIDGAEQGDMLVVHFERILPNRATGWSSTGVDPSLVDPWHVRKLPLPPEDQPWQPAVWDIDNAASAVRLRAPGTRLDGFTLPMDCMSGCFGVSPADGEWISTATSGPHGGNMDYRGFRAGSTVYLPVFVPGALFGLGDGHAVQSDGEIAGTGVEVSMDVVFRVELVKHKQIGWPRGENAVEIFTTGNARPMLQALQHATTEMLLWLQQDYGFTAHEAGLLAGQVARYEVGNVFDPAYTMVCKIEKRLLDIP